MLFAVTWVNEDGATEERDKRTLKLFTNWKSPAGFDFKGFYDYVDGNGGVAIVEATSAEVMFEVFAPWATFFDFTCRPIVATEKCSSASSKGHSPGAIRCAEICGLAMRSPVAIRRARRNASAEPRTGTRRRRSDDGRRRRSQRLVRDVESERH